MEINYGTDCKDSTQDDPTVKHKSIPEGDFESEEVCDQNLPRPSRAASSRLNKPKLPATPLDLSPAPNMPLDRTTTPEVVTVKWHTAFTKM
ncbi:hypothetical protein J6590_031433 [Homalodisca vitripennis]|nr:hypothetical protein J6590_031433 [Homalodisca vitripennis]